jgi:hypothetical protein
MKISELKARLNDVDTLVFELPNGTTVPAHFHVTEVGLVTKHFIDCGGTVRIELIATQTNCLAQDKCGIPPTKLKVELKTIGTNTAGTCTPGVGCC